MGTRAGLHTACLKKRRQRSAFPNYREKTNLNEQTALPLPGAACTLNWGHRAHFAFTLAPPEPGRMPGTNGALKTKHLLGGAWVARSGKRLARGFSSGHELTVQGFEPHVGPCADSVEPAWGSLSPSLSAPLRLPPLLRSHVRSLSLTCAHALSLKIKKT